MEPKKMNGPETMMIIKQLGRNKPNKPNNPDKAEAIAEMLRTLPVVAEEEKEKSKQVAVSPMNLDADTGSDELYSMNESWALK